MSDIMGLLSGSDDSLYEDVIKSGFLNRILIINQEINDDIIENYIYKIIEWNREDKDIPKEKRKPITLYINSPGGDAVLGFTFVNVITNSITPIRAIGFGCVASMAFHIFICCHERIAFKDTVLLMHDGEVTVSNSSRKANDTMQFIREMEDRTKAHVIKYTNMTDDFYDDHYDAEFYLYADTLGKKYNCVDKIIGEDVDINYIF